MARLCRNVFLSGRVQGVAFRYYTQLEAEKLGLDGWVRNLFDGRVEVWIEGEASAVRAMLAWLEHGPSHARVSRCEQCSCEERGLRGFEIRSSSCA